MVKNARELDVYQRAYANALEIHKISKDFPKDEQFSLTSQIRRSSKSVCANIVEGFAKNAMSTAEFKRFCSMAVGSSEEVKVWIDFSKDLAYISEEQWKHFTSEYDIISKQIYTMIKNWEK